MKRQKSKNLKRILAAAMTLGFVLCSAVTVLAAPADSGTPNDDAEAAFTKTLQMPDGTTTPAATFTFSITKTDLDGSLLASDLAAMPAISNVSLVFAAADIGTTVAGTKTVMQETGNVFKAANMSGYWTRAGVYHYTVTELPGTYTTTTGETMTYSGGSYDLYAYVENHATGTNNTGLYLKMIMTKVGTPDIPAIPGGSKVPPSPGTPGVPSTYSKLVFTNTFSKIGGPNPATNSVLDISKNVTGNFANQSLYFDYTLNATHPPVLGLVPQTYRVYVLDDANTNVTSAANGITIAGTDLTYGDYFEVTSGTPATFKLKHNQRLAFTDLHYGASYTVTEAAVVDWTPNYTLTVNGGVPTATTNATENIALTVPTTVIGDSGDNIAAYSNAWKTVIPTGLDINDLPFIMMLVVAAGAVVAFVVVKYRKKARQSSK